MKENNHYLEVAISAAREAGRIQMLHFGKPHSIEYKGEFNPVTEVDHLCDETIQKILLQAFPDHEMLTEESPFKKKDSVYRWVIDPIDGTTNYLRGFPCFAVSIALEVESELRIGVIYIPPLDELFYAEKGKGAFLNGKRISVSREPVLNRSFLSTGFPYDVHEHSDFYLRYFHQFIKRSFAIRRPGSAAVDIAYVAAGRFDGFWEFKLHPWDMAAGILLVTEAGGRVTDFKGGPFSIYAEETLASNGLIHEQMLQVIQETEGEIGRWGDQEIRRSGDQEIRRSGDQEIRRSGE
ncbi:MAG: inositol monophosphatase [Deltaproteobacteria bacterium]|nr:inositol monophosphatase [Deltaproteobacteria bacterium]